MLAKYPRGWDARDFGTLDTEEIRQKARKRCCANKITLATLSPVEYVGQHDTFPFGVAQHYICIR